MPPSTLLELTYRMLTNVLMLSLPVVAVAVLVGLIIGVLQAVTQIQDQSVGFGFKLLAAIGVIALTARWTGGELLRYATDVFGLIAQVR